ncbi:MAG: hypothetical protein HOP11_01035 [Saprospiraceae bacterium]|nr:hypothetical protein [Saprospiraceae bacterium]
MSKIKRFENFHILLWLLKDTSWLLEFRIFATMIAIPTIAVAIHIAYLSYKWKKFDFWLQVAVCFWISANSYWMTCELFGYEELENYAVILFVLGFISTFIYFGSRKSVY